MERQRALTLLIISLLLLLFLAKFFQICSVEFNQDEFLELHYAWRIWTGEQPYGPSWERFKTPLMSYYLCIAHYLGDSVAGTMYFARFSILPFALLMLYGAYRGASFLFDSRAGLIALLALSCNTTFVDFSFALRSDLISSSIWALVLYLILREGEEEKAEVHGLPTVIGLLLLLAFLFTQKCYHYILLTFLILLLLPGKRGRMRPFLECSLSSALALLLYYCFMGYSAFEANFLGPIRASSISSSGIGMEAIYSTWRWFLQESYRSLPFWIFALLGLIFVFSSFYHRRASSGELRLALALMGNLFFVVNHAEQFPHIYLMLLPSLTLSFVLALYRIEGYFGYSESLTLVLALIVLLPPVGMRLREQLQPSLRLQYQIANIEWSEALSKRDDSVFDGVGMSFRRPSAYGDLCVAKLYSYRKGQMPDLIERLVERKCKLWIKNSRHLALPAREKRWLREHFIHDWGNVFILGIAMDYDGGVRDFSLLSGGRFQLHWTGEGRARIDGRSLDGDSLVLRPGKHSFEAESTGVLELRYRAKATKLPDWSPRNPSVLFKDYAQ